MRMQVNEAGHDILPTRLHDLLRLMRLEIADFCDEAVLDPNVGLVAGKPGPVHHHFTSDDNVEFRHVVFSSKATAAPRVAVYL
jgi:hypothetical protein